MHYFLFCSIFVVALCVSMIIIPIIIRWAHKQNVYAITSHRSSHSVPTPALGGVAIFIALLCIIPFVSVGSQIGVIAACGITLFTLGIVDDFYDVKAVIKLVVQILIGCLLFYYGLKIDNLHGVLGVHRLNDFWSFCITISLVVVGINSFNLIDGINGLAGGLTSVNSLVFGLVFLVNGQFNYALLSFALLGAIMGFLKYNFGGGSIFMGDTGSLLIGFLMTVFFIVSFQTQTATDLSIAVAFASIVIPMFDLVRLFATRLIEKKNPMMADKNHLHHLVLKLTKRHSSATCLIGGVHISLFLLVGCNYYLDGYLLVWQVLLFLIIGTFMFFCGALFFYMVRDFRSLRNKMRELDSKNSLLRKL